MVVLQDTDLKIPVLGLGCGFGLELGLRILERAEDTVKNMVREGKA